MNSVKRLAVLTISLAIALFSATPALFAEAETVYPDETFEPYLTFENLADYAVEGDNFAFAQNLEGESVISVYAREKDSEFGTLTTLCRNEFEIADLDVNEGVYYFSDTSGGIYKDEGTETEYEFVKTNRIDYNEFISYSLIDGVLKVINLEEDLITTLEGSYKKIKKYGETVYVIKDDVLYSLNGTTLTAVNTAFRYYDYEKTSSIEVGNTADLLKIHSFSFVKIDAGAYMTRVDLTDLSERYFKTDSTQKTTKPVYALLLCTVDDAIIVGVQNYAYITSSKWVTALSVEENKLLYTEEEHCGFDDGATITGNRIYAKPYVSKGLTAADNATGHKVSVIRQIKSDILGYTFYEVLYSLGGATRTGYVAEGFLTPTLKEDTEPGVYPGEDNPDYSEKNNVTTVVLVIALVVAVLAAIGYLTYVGTSDKRKKKKKSARDDEDDDDEDEED